MSEVAPQDQALTVPFWRKVGLSAGRAAIGSLAITLPAAALGALGGDYGTAAWVSAAVAAVTAAVRAVQAIFTTLETPK